MKVLEQALSHAQHLSSRIGRLLLVTGVYASAFLTGSQWSQAQCTLEWRPGNGLPSLFGTVHAVTAWDPDGLGPQPTVLVAGGQLPLPSANNITQWDGTSWSSLGTGMSAEVYALTVYNGALIAGGQFTTAGGNSANRIARWDGSSWSTLGSGMNGTVYALTVYNGALIAGGSFTTAGGVGTNNIARWDGSSWSPLGSGASNGVNAELRALTVYNGELIAGGLFTTAGGNSANRIARWDGSSWSTLGSGMTNTVSALTVYNGELIAGGSFTTAGGVGTNNIARWDGSSWSPLGSGASNGVDAEVRALVVDNGALIAGGQFTTAGGASANRIARWNGSVWSVLGSGMGSAVLALTEYSGELIAGGSFSTAGGNSVSFIARWNGSGWFPLGNGISQDVFALTEYDGALIAGGLFQKAGGSIVNQIAGWDGSRWSPLSNGIQGSFPRVDALVEYNGDLIVGGFFGAAGGGTGVLAASIAKWNGSSWSDLGSGMTSTGCGDCSSVHALTVYNGDLIAGGFFTTAGGTSASNIAKWNGSSWSALGSGMNADVAALTVYNGELIAGGGFTTAGGSSVNYIARWNGSSWSALSGGLNGNISALTVYNGELIAGGGFTTAGGSGGNHIARWNGSSWFNLGSGMNSSVNELTVYNGALIAGGSFTTAGGISASRIAQWNDGSWSALGSGMDSFVQALAVYDSELIAGGSFDTAGGIVSSRWARWGPTSNDTTDTDGDGILDICDICPTTPCSEIGVEQPLGTDVADGGTKDFGSVAVSGNASLVFTIKNTGNGDLTGLGITVDGADAALFTVSVTPTAPVSGGGGSTTFTVRFAPTSAGAKTAALHIANNDGDENPFDITLGGTGTVPEIVVEQPLGINVGDGGSRSFGSVAENTNTSLSFTIKNVGDAVLTGLGTIIDGADAAMFTVTASPSGTVISGGSTTFTVRFSPTSIGAKTAALHIASNDADENPFDIDLSGTGLGPEIVVEQPPGTDIVDGGTKDFAGVVVGGNASLVFTIRNTGNADLTGLTISKLGPDNALFTVTANPTAPVSGPNGSTTFTARFAPITPGVKTATFRIANNDANENPFDINLTGIGTLPEIVVEQPLGTDVADGGSRDFGNPAVGDIASLTFTIKNTGDADLTGLGITINGTDASMFTVTASPTAPVSGPGGSTAFTVRFAPASSGAKTAALHIASNDSDENPFDINLTGTGMAVEISVDSFADGGTAPFGSVVVGSAGFVTFTIRNVGNVDLTGLGITIDGAHASMFAVTASPTAPVSGPSGSTTFTVRFAPTSFGPKTAALHIANNDADENPYDINLTGQGNGSEITVEQPLGTDIADGGSRDFGSVAAGGNTSLVFTIRNTGNRDLSGIVVTTDGTDAALFTVTANPGATVPVGSSTTFTVRFAPITGGIKSAAVHIASNDGDENPFDIIVSGTGLVPEIVVEQPLGADVADGGMRDFGNVTGNASLVFTIRNIGGVNLTGLGITINGTDASMFAVTTSPAAPVGPNGSTTFTVRFTPTSFGAMTAALHIASNDGDENPFDINLTGTGIMPEISVEQPLGTNIVDGGSKSFGSVVVGGDTSLTFTIKNAGNADLTGLDITINGTDASMFTVTAFPSAPVSGPGGSTAFTVRFAPTSTGPKTAALHIANNDLNENPFDIFLSGTGTAPEIVIEQPLGTNVTDGGAREFGSVVVSGNTSLVYTIRNIGSADLTGLGITIDGADASMFAVTTNPTAPVGGPTGSTTFTVRFAPTSTGARTAAMHIANNDGDENPFDINLSGAGLFDCASLGCNDGNVCTDDSCDSAFGCQHVNNAASCDDSDLCTQNDACQSGVCVGGAAAPNGTPCNDGTACTQADTCQAGSCIGGNPAPGGTACDDGKPCTVGETCRAGSCLAPATFAQAAGSPVPVGGVQPACLAVADLNRDGTLDLAVGNMQSNNVTILLGNGAGGFSQPAGSPVAVGAGPLSVAVGDWNGDENIDLAVANGIANTVTILMGDGLGGFSQAAGSPFLSGSTPSDIAVGSWNGDGFTDLAVAHANGNEVKIFLGNGSGQFSNAPGSPVAAGNFPHYLATGDWNGDGHADLVAANRFGSNLTLLVGNGSGGFSQAAGSPITVGLIPSSPVAGDWNADGLLDLAVSVEASQSVRILLGNGTGAFTGSDVSVSGVTSIAAGDLNGDGKLDLAAVKQGLDVVSILLGNGLGGFTEAAGSPIAVGVQPRAVGVGDWNEDGRLDVAVGNQTPKNVTILLNTTATALGGSACDDGNECTVADTCDAWTCAGDPVPDGAACDDDNTCTSTDNCESGACVGADPEPEGSPCDDLNGCTQQDVCQSGACRGASPVVCTASDQCHVVGTCNAAAGVCSNPAKANGTACNDVNACTQTDTCQSGTCTGANPVVCTASDPCHAAGICNPGTAVCSNPAAPDGTGCNDGNACTTGDACSGGACGGTPGSPPAEVDSGVRLARSGSDAVISWQLAAGATSSAVLRGLVGALPVGPGGGDETCLAGSLPSTTLSWPDSLNPASGSCFWYLIRGDNACGHGSYGLQGVHGVPGAPRVSTTCP